MADFLVLTPIVIAHSIVRVVFHKFKESNHILSIRDVITRPIGFSYFVSSRSTKWRPVPYEFVFEGREQSIEGLSNKGELQVSLQTYRPLFFIAII